MFGSKSLSIVLVAMPFGSTRLPSIQLGLLKSMAKNCGYRVEVKYFNIEFAKLLGWEKYEQICSQDCRLLGDWLFSESAFKESSPNYNKFLDNQELDVFIKKSGMSINELIDLRENVVREFIDCKVREVDWNRFGVVGFSSVFEQNCATLAMARAIKEHHPNIITLFGGANFDGDMGQEMITRFSWIDYIISGESEESFPAFLNKINDGENPTTIKGVKGQGSSLLKDSVRSDIIRDMDLVPTPDYEEFYITSAMMSAPKVIGNKWIFLPMETARGCWWGAKSHCTFCGLNATGMTYRSQSPQKVLDNIKELAKQYSNSRFFIVDNILDHSYIKDVFLDLHSEKMDYEFWCEVKANLKPEQIKDIAKGGVRWIQPGIESLNTHVLKLMKKGSDSFMNLRCLKWAQYYGLEVFWNILYGFPGETEEDYIVQNDLLSSIIHLTPPDDIGHIRMDRFSPYFDHPEVWGLKNINPHPAYAKVYPEKVEHHRLAYYFSYENPTKLPEATYTPLINTIAAWQEAWSQPQKPALSFSLSGGQIRFVDLRNSQDIRYYLYDYVESLVYQYCNYTYKSINQVLCYLHEKKITITKSALLEIIDEFYSYKLIWKENDKIFALALPQNKHY